MPAPLDDGVLVEFDDGVPVRLPVLVELGVPVWPPVLVADAVTVLAAVGEFDLLPEFVCEPVLEDVALSALVLELVATLEAELVNVVVLDELSVGV